MKILRESLQHYPHIVARFIEEAEVTAQLQHPGVVPIHDRVLLDGRLWFTMREVGGRTLADAIAALHDGEAVASEDYRRGQRRLVEAIRRACAAVAFAHEPSAAWCTATSNLPTSCSAPTTTSSSSTGASPGRRGAGTCRMRAASRPSRPAATPPSCTRPRSGRSRGRPPTWRPSRPGARSTGSGPGATSSSGSPCMRPSSERRRRTARPPPPATTTRPRTRPGRCGRRPPPTGPPAWTGRPPLRAHPGTATRAAQRAAGHLLARPRPGAPGPLPVCGRPRGGPPSLARWRTAARPGHRARRPGPRQGPRPRGPRGGGPADGARGQPGAPGPAPVGAHRPESPPVGPAGRGSRGVPAREPGQPRAGDAPPTALTRVPDLPDAQPAPPRHYAAVHRQLERTRRDPARVEAQLRRHTGALPPQHPDRAPLRAYPDGRGLLTLHTDPPGATVTIHRLEEVQRRLVPTEGRSLSDPPRRRRAARRQLPVRAAPSRPGDRHLPRAHRAAGPLGRPAPGRDPAPPRAPPPRRPRPPGGPLRPRGPHAPRRPRRRPRRLAAAPVWVEGFIIQETPVTNADYLAFINDPAVDGDRWAPQERPNPRGEPGSLLVARTATGRFELTIDPDGDEWTPAMPAVYVNSPPPAPTRRGCRRGRTGAGGCPPSWRAQGLPGGGRAALPLGLRARAHLGAVPVVRTRPTDPDRREDLPRGLQPLRRPRPRGQLRGVDRRRRAGRPRADPRGRAPPPPAGSGRSTSSAADSGTARWSATRGGRPRASRRWGAGRRARLPAGLRPGGARALRGYDLRQGTRAGTAAAARRAEPGPGRQGAGGCADAPTDSQRAWPRRDRRMAENRPGTGGRAAPPHPGRSPGRGTGTADRPRRPLPHTVGFPSGSRRHPSAPPRTRSTAPAPASAVGVAVPLGARGAAVDMLLCDEAPVVAVGLGVGVLMFGALGDDLGPRGQGCSPPCRSGRGSPGCAPRCSQRPA